MYVSHMANTDNSGTNAADAEIADRIESALKDKRMSALALSEQSGIAYPTLRRSLKGGRSLTFAEFDKIATTIGVHPSSLLPATLTTAAAA